MPQFRLICGPEPQKRYHKFLRRPFAFFQKHLHHASQQELGLKPLVPDAPFSRELRTEEQTTGVLGELEAVASLLLPVVVVVAAEEE
jgi:hypothetical protein